MRAELGGKGYPRSEFALEGAGVDTSGDAPIILLLEDGEIFIPADYISLDYTHFEVWCVGAVGGQGGGSTGDVEFSIAHTQVAMPSDVWNAYTNWHRENMNQLSMGQYGYLGGRGYNPDAFFYGPTGEYVGNLEGWLHSLNPGHIAEIQTFRDAFLKKNSAPGGGGGGGGMQIAYGALAELDAEVPVSVGEAGADGVMGQNKVNGAWSPPPRYKTLLDVYGYPHLYNYSYTDSMDAHYDYLKNWQNVFDSDGLPSFYPPTPGGDGGASSFGDICKASGGKGGSPFGVGGAGGKGGTIVAGGGGGHTKDGVWDRVSIAQGGGGGGGQGGKGAFSYADTSIYGPPGLPGTFRGTDRRFDYVTGDVLEEIPWPAYKGIAFVAPSGGSVKLPGNRKYGSRAPGYDPNGAVLIRLTKVA